MLSLVYTVVAGVSFPGVSARVVNTTYHHLGSRLRIHGATPPLSYAPLRLVA